MYERIDRIKKRVVIDAYPICIEKYKISIDVKEQTKNDPIILQRAKILDATVERMPIAIADDELLVGIGASKHMGLEIDPDYGIWPQDEIDSLKEDGYLIDPEDEIELQRLNARHPATFIGKMGEIFYEDGNERLLNMLRAGLILPPWKAKAEGEGVGGGYAQSGLGLGPSLTLLCVDYTKFVNVGVDALIEQAEAEKAKIRFDEKGAVEKYRYYKAVIISLNAAKKLAARYAALAAEMAEQEQEPVRKAELARIARICERVPAKPARNFREAMQAFWFNFLLLSPAPTLPGGRFDQLVYPFYKKDLEAGEITREEAVELLCCLRLKDMELNRTSGKNLRKKNAGMAKWHNFVIGGVDKDGNDASNDISYMMLDAALITKTPHHTITLRVHKDSPMALIEKGIEVVRAGLGMPAFIGDESYIKTFTTRGFPEREARDYIITGCLDVNLPGMSRTGPVPMVTIPLIFDIFRHRGIDKTTGLRVAPDMGDFKDFKSYDELFAAFKAEFDYVLRLVGEKNNIELKVTQELLPDPLRSALMYEGIESGEDTFCRTMPFENGAVINPIGMVNVGDSMAAIKKLVFDEGKYSMAQLYEALEADWVGYEQMQKDFENAPKFGNDIDYVDKIVADCYKALCDIAETMPTILGGVHIPTGISITSHQPGGALTGATPDGRKAWEILADGTMSPMHGVDTHGPTAVFNSAMKVDQDPFQATLLNMKFHPSALKTEEDRLKLGWMIKSYLTHGGKHVQFNVVDRETLCCAKADPKAYRELVVRIAGYSAYFVQLNAQMQDEVIARVEHVLN